jgi:hypothetical protein
MLGYSGLWRRNGLRLPLKLRVSLRIQSNMRYYLSADGHECNALLEIGTPNLRNLL